MLMYVLLTEGKPTGALKSTMKEYGELSAMTTGTTGTSKLYANCLVFPLTGNMDGWAMLCLEKEQDLYGWMMSGVMEAKAISICVLILDGVYTIVPGIMKMPEFIVIEVGPSQVLSLIIVVRLFLYQHFFCFSGTNLCPDRTDSNMRHIIKQVVI